jgi:hypothetical protein
VPASFDAPIIDQPTPRARSPRLTVLATWMSKCVLRLLRRLDPTESAPVRERVLRFAEQPDNAFALIDRFATMRDRMGISVDGLTIEEIETIKSDLLASGPPDVENPFRSLIGADLAALKIERSLGPARAVTFHSLRDLRSIVLESSLRTFWRSEVPVR